MDGCLVDLRAREVRWPDRQARLTPTEAALLRWLAAAQGEVVSRAALLREVWGYRPGVNSRTLDTTMRRLRKKVEVNPAAPRHLVTQVGEGYRFVPLAPAVQRSVGVADLDPFIGREGELARLDALAASGARLITVVAPGGMGKTRLASRWVTARSGLVVELAGLRRPHELPVAVAAGVGHTGPLDLTHLGAALVRRGVTWLLLDNLEQLLPAAGPTIRALALAAPGVGVLCTSRERLDLPGETVVELGPLSEDEAVALLRVRAPGAFDGASPSQIDALTRRLCGMPLALELAASRVGMLGVQELVARLERSLSVLKAPGRTGRQSSMRAAVAWSWALLSPGQRAALGRLTVFRGGMRPAAACAVLGGDSAEEMLQVLRSKSWLVARPNPGPGPVGGQRLVLLEPLRELILEEGVGADDAADRHAAWYCRLGEDGPREALDQGDGRGRDALGAELWNLFAAAERAVECSRDDEAAGCLLAAYEVSRVRSPGDDLARRIQALLDRDGVSDRVAARLLVVLADLQRRIGASETAFASASRARALAAQIGDVGQQALAVQVLGILYQGKGDHAAAVARDLEALALASAAGATRTEATTHTNLGSVLHLLGRLDEAQEHHLAAIRLHHAQGNRRLEAVANMNLAVLWHERGELDVAADRYRTSMACYRQIGDLRNEGLVMGNLGSLELDRGDPVAARRHLEAALLIDQQVGAAREEAIALWGLAELHRRAGDLRAARQLLDRALRLASPERFHIAHHVLEALAGEVDAGLGDPTGGRARIAAAEWALLQAGAVIEEAIACCRRGRVAVVAGDDEAAHAALEHARAVLVSNGVGPRSELGVQIAALVALAADRAALTRCRTP